MLERGTRRNLFRKIRFGGARRNQLCDQLQNARPGKNCCGIEGPARARACDLYWPQRASKIDRTSGFSHRNERSEAPVHETYSRAAWYRLLKVRSPGILHGLV